MSSLDEPKDRGESAAAQGQGLPDNLSDQASAAQDRMRCASCMEPILPGEDRADIINMDAHRECALRDVIGGIGHLIDHEHFCSGVGPDAGLDRRTSALLVDVWVRRKGVEAATLIGKEE